MSDLFTGTIAKASPLYGTYEPGAALLIAVEGEAIRHIDPPVLADWETLWEAFNESGQRIGHLGFYHTTAPWNTTRDVAYDGFTFICGAAPEASFNARIKLSARHALGGIGFGVYTFLADKYVAIHVMGSVVTPSPIPTPTPTPLPSPSPAPEPTPPPSPTPTPTPGGGIGDLFAGMPTWGWIALAGVAILLLMPRGKK